MLHKIYSRPRIKIPKVVIGGKRGDDKRRKRIVKITIIFLIAFLTVKTIIDATLPIFDTLCENRAESIATLVSNEQATNVMKRYNYDELFTIEKDEQGNIKMIRANVIVINEIISDVANKIQEELNNKGREDVEIALRKFYWIKNIIWKRSWNKNKNFISRRCCN